MHLSRETVEWEGLYATKKSSMDHVFFPFSSQIPLRFVPTVPRQPHAMARCMTEVRRIETSRQVME